MEREKGKGKERRESLWLIKLCRSNKTSLYLFYCFYFQYPLHIKKKKFHVHECTLLWAMPNDNYIPFPIGVAKNGNRVDSINLRTCFSARAYAIP